MTDTGTPKEPKKNYQAITPATKAPDVASEAKPDRPSMEKIITGEVLPLKKPFFQRVVDYFTGDDMKSIGHYVFFDVVLPAAKSLLYDAGNAALERRLFGDRGRTGVGGQTRGYIAYNRIATGVGQVINNRPTPTSPREIPLNAFENIVLASRADCVAVIDTLASNIDQYTCALVRDLYELVNLPISIADEKMGWTDLRNASVRPVANGYLLVLPRPIALD